MALWLMRAGKHGENEKKFLGENRIYLTWNKLSHDLSALENRRQLREILKETFPNASNYRIGSHLGQIWAFSQVMKKDDWIVLPSKLKPAIHVARMKGDYTFDDAAEVPFCHYRDVEWIVQDVPRTNFDQDLLYSFSAFKTICQIRRNDAEQRIHEMAMNEWKSSGVKSNEREDGEEEEGDTSEPDEILEDIAEAARDQIGKLIIARFKGHGMARLVDAVLRARGYSTFLSPEGPDKGIDILAAPEPMGFGEPRICVQVKSGDSPLDRPTLDQLIGAMSKVKATHGLLVSWGGFKSSVDREEATQFFQVRLWDQGDLISQVLTYYDKLDEEIRTELPLKRIWVVSEVME